MKIKYFLVLVLVLSLFIGTQDVFAGGRKLGTAGAAELLIPMGARNVAMGGADIASVRNTEAMYWNPAGLSVLQGSEAKFTYMNYFADMNVSYFALGTQLGSFGVAGLSLQALDIGDIPVTTISNPEGTGEMLRPNFITLNATFSKAFTDRINFGLNTKIISEKVGEMSASAVAFDFGLQYRSPMGVNFGVVMRNYGSNLQFGGTPVEFNTDIPFANPNATTRITKLDMASHELPASLNMGLSYRYNFTEDHSVNISGLYNNSNYALDEINTGLEYSFRDFFFLRGGYNAPLYSDNFPEDAKEYQFGLNFGFGLQLDLGAGNMMFDYAYREMETFDAVQYFTVGFGF
ncbi:MAG: PorV/PorQ family protein [Calditrichia bacterium]